MEEIVGAILEGLVEIILESVLYYPFDRPRSRSGRKDDGFAGWLLMFLVLGCGLGGVLTWYHPRVLLAHPWMRIVNVLVMPFLSGWVSLQIARLRQLKDPDVRPWKHFMYATVFTFGFAGVRFFFGQR